MHDPGIERNLRRELKSDDARDLVAVQGTLRGEDRAFDDIVERYTPMLYSLSYKLLGNREEAEDAVQEIFARAYRALRSFRLEARFYTWLYTLALNWLRSKLRKQKRQRFEVPLPDRFDETEVASDRASDPVQPLIVQDEYRRARSALERLKPMYRIVFVMHYDEAMPLKEIAEILGMPLNTVKVRLHRARQLLVRELTGTDDAASVG